MVSAISLLLLHGPTTYLIGTRLMQCLVDVLMRWTLESHPTSVPIECDMHDIIASGIGFLDKMTSTQEFDPDLSFRKAELDDEADMDDRII
jgi:hypothetical protein